VTDQTDQTDAARQVILPPPPEGYGPWAECTPTTHQDAFQRDEPTAYVEWTVGRGEYAAHHYVARPASPYSA
jgi:hypothetical protein